ncbi:MAG: serine/threonine protein kinase, partial [Gemmataceae bacterium]|nr:serine/threonine protein kinase [Gemmataceae bacterium]
VVLDDYADRYPRQADELRKLAAKIEAAAAVAPSSAARVPAAPVTAVMATNADRVRKLATGGDPSETWDQPIAFGRYSIVRPLGRGGMGTVYLAHDPRLDRDVALKIPTRDLTANARVSELMMREARAAARLHHPNICPVYDVGFEDGVPYITSLYIDGEPLSAIAKRRPLLDAQVAKLVATVARALDYAHRAGVVHRDLKPSNVMLDRAGNPVVMDFGLASRTHPDEPDRVSSTALAGSPAYMAPEQLAEGRSGPATDIYALGVVLYELLTGRLPFRAAAADLWRQVIHEPAPPPSRHRRGLSPTLDAACVKALAKRPEDRFASMAAFADALDAPHAGPRAGMGHTVLLIAGAVAVIAAAAVAVWALRQ